MKTSRRSVLLLASLLVLASTVGFCTQLTLEQTKQVRVLAHYTSINAFDNSGPLLERHGYAPSADRSVWQQWPAFRKIEAACLEAENAEPNRGAAKVITLLAQDISRSYGSIFDDVILSKYVSKPALKLNVRFKRLEPGQASTELQPWIAKAAGALSVYCSGGPLGLPQDILQKDFELTEEQAYDILRQSGKTAQAFERALTYVPEQQRIPALQHLYWFACRAACLAQWGAVDPRRADWALCLPR